MHAYLNHRLTAHQMRTAPNRNTASPLVLHLFAPLDESPQVAEPRGAVRIGKNAHGARNYSQCDSLLIGDKCGAHTFPYLEIKNTSARVEHEASTLVGHFQPAQGPVGHGRQARADEIPRQLLSMRDRGRVVCELVPLFVWVAALVSGDAEEVGGRLTLLRADGRIPLPPRRRNCPPPLPASPGPAR